LLDWTVQQTKKHFAYICRVFFYGFEVLK
jgi:hypothetical protein